jgi:predicted alpha/beta superfamily hydrolase
MRRVGAGLSTIVALSLLGTQVIADVPLAATNAQTAVMEPVEIVLARQFDFKSTINGRVYRVKIAVPASTPPSGGFPTIYVLDGDAFFSSFAEAVRRRSEVRELEPAVVVGITYPLETEAMTHRMYDLSPSSLPEDEKAAVRELPADAEYGGADSFYEVVEREIKPRVSKEATINAERSVLFGWSLGGLYVLHTLFTHPAAFQTYVSLSPSIWWNHKAIMNEVAPFERRIASGEAAPRVYIGVGGLEQTVPKGALPPGFTRIAIEKELSAAQMVGNVENLAARLSGLKAGHGYQVKSRVFKDETHNSVPWAALGPILEFSIPHGPTAMRPR